KTLAHGIRAIRAEHAIPADPSTLTDDILAQKLGLVLPQEVVEHFMAMLNGTIEYTAVETGVTPDDQLTSEPFKNAPGIRTIRYNQDWQEQQLTFRGVLTDKVKNHLTDEVHELPPILAGLLDDVQTQ